MAALAERLASARALCDALRSAPGFVHISASESEALQEVLNQTPISVADVPALVAEVQAIQLNQVDEVSVLETLARRVAPLPSPSLAQPAMAPVGGSSAASSAMDAAGLAAPCYVAPTLTPRGSSRTQSWEHLVNYWPREVPWGASPEVSVPAAGPRRIRNDS